MTDLADCKGGCKEALESTSSKKESRSQKVGTSSDISGPSSEDLGTEAGLFLTEFKPVKTASVPKNSIKALHGLNGLQYVLPGSAREVVLK